MKTLKYILLFCISSVLLSSCYTSTIDALSTFKFQLPLLFHSDYVNKAAPDTSVDFSNLNKYQEYRDNKSKLKKAEIISFNYWIDSLIIDNGKPFDPAKDDIEFDYVRFSLIFAQLKSNPPKPGDIYDKDNYEAIPNAQEYVLGEFTNVKVQDYYRESKHILQISDDVAKVISSAVKDNPTFFIRSMYSKTKGQTAEKRYFPLIWGRFDCIIRFEVNL